MSSKFPGKMAFYFETQIYVHSTLHQNHWWHMGLGDEQTYITFTFSYTFREMIIKYILVEIVQNNS